jgi:flagella basal body P-ring formation protein FlgA
MTINRACNNRHPAARQRRFVAGVACLLALLDGTARAGTEGYTGGEIRAIVAGFLRAQLGDSVAVEEIRIAPVQDHLNLPVCSDGPVAFIPPGRTLDDTSAVGLRCSGGRPWTLYVPVDLQQFLQVVVSARPVPRGRALTTEDVKLERVPRQRAAAGALTELDAALGAIARRPLSAGTILTAAAVQAPRAVRRGQQVVIYAEAEGMHVQATGEALADATDGATVRVRNALSKKIVSGTVTGPGRVRIEY